MRLPVVGVMGSGSEPWTSRAEPLGRWLAERGVHLLTGGGGGVMAAVSAAFASVEGRAGLCLGILPGDEHGSAPPGYPNDAVELAIRTHLPVSGHEGTSARSRNHLNVLSSDVVVALPGGAGTASEVALALRYGRRVVGWWEVAEERPPGVERVEAATSFEELCARLEAWL